LTHMVCIVSACLSSPSIHAISNFKH